LKIVHLSYAVVKPVFTDPVTWLKRINFSVGVMEGMAKYASVSAVYHINYRGQFEKNGIAYYFTHYNRWQLFFPFQFHRLLKKLAPDVVIVHGLNTPWQIFLLRFSCGKKIRIIAQHHAERPFTDLRQYLQRLADNYISAYLFSSFDLGQLWVEKKQIRNANKIKEVMGTSSPFSPMNKEEAKQITGVSNGITYLWVGGLNENKDPLTVANAFIPFLKKVPEVQLYFIYQSYELESQLKALISTSVQAKGRIHLVGKIENEHLDRWYNSADFIISSSHYEGSGIAVCEALSCGCIPIVTNIPSFRMMTDNGRIGLLYPAGDSDLLFGRLIESVKIDLKKTKELVLERFEEKLSFDANARQIMEVIEMLK
jgi:glycosyltransferase involved in cell wall biosynthesis